MIPEEIIALKARVSALENNNETERRLNGLPVYTGLDAASVLYLDPVTKRIKTNGLNLWYNETTGNLTARAITTANDFAFAQRNGQACIGNVNFDWNPTANWTTDTTLLLHGKDISSIGFHDSGSRVDFITLFSGIFSIGYDGGFGVGNVSMPGRVAINNGNHGTAGTASLLVKGRNNASSEYAIRCQNLGNVDLMYVLNNGVAWVVTPWVTPSDRRLKTNIEPLHVGLNEIMSINPVSYTKTVGENTYQELGFVAQEVEEVLPELITVEEETSLLGVKHTELLPVMVRAIQEQQQIIEQQQIRIESIESRLAVLEARLEHIGA